MWRGRPWDALAFSPRELHPPYGDARTPFRYNANATRSRLKTISTQRPCSNDLKIAICHWSVRRPPHELESCLGAEGPAADLSTGQQFRSSLGVYPRWRMDRSPWSCLVLRPGRFFQCQSTVSSVSDSCRCGKRRSREQSSAAIRMRVTGPVPGRMLGSDTRSNRAVGRSARHPCEGCPGHTEALKLQHHLVVTFGAKTDAMKT